MDLSTLASVTDPSDFPIDNLRKLDSSLRCTICKDFYDAPVMLHCGHTFCSLCIRSVLPNKPECPICRMAAKESHLVRNTMFGEAVNSWLDVRACVLKYSEEHVNPSPASPITSRKKRRIYSSSLYPDLDQEAGPSRLPPDRDSSNPCDAETRGNTEQIRKACRRSIAEEEIIPSSDPEEQEWPNPAGTNPSVACPLCSLQVPYNSINRHMDSNCRKFITNDSLGGSVGSAGPDSKTVWGTIFKGPAKKAAVVSNPRDLEIPTTRIAKVSYGLLNLGGLRKLLAEKGLSATGDKEELITRHERWLAIFNANLDRPQPKTVAELKRQLKELEETGNRPAPKKVVDEREWARKNNAQFASLIEAARSTAKSTKEVKPLGSQTTDNGPSSSLDYDVVTTSSDVIVID